MHDNHPKAWNPARLRELRELHGWTTRGFAKHCGISYEMISRYESDRDGRATVPGFTIAALLADALGVSLDTFRQPVGDAVCWLENRKPSASPDGQVKG